MTGNNSSLSRRPDESVRKIDTITRQNVPGNEQNSSADRAVFKSSQSKYFTTVKQAQQQYNSSRLISCDTDNPRTLRKTVDNLLHRHQPSPPLKHPHKELAFHLPSFRPENVNKPCMHSPMPFIPYPNGCLQTADFKSNRNRILHGLPHRSTVQPHRI